MPRTLLAYSTVDGHTVTICRRVAAGLQARGHEVTLMTVDEALGLDMGTGLATGTGEGEGRTGAPYDRIILGASIRYGHHRPAVHEFVRRHREALDRLPSAFFSVCAVARKPGKNTAEGNPYCRKFLQATGWRPRVAAAFGGRINYPALGWADRVMIQFIMWITRGPTDRRAAFEFTDWDAVDRYAQEVAAL